MLKKKYGLPVVSKNNIFSVLDELGLKAWQSTKKPVPLEQYKQRYLSEAQRKELDYAPKIEVATFCTPHGDQWCGFRTIGRHGTVIFCLLPDNLIPICAEFRHGCEVISINLPGGVYTTENPEECAKREFEEETGIYLEKLVALTTNGVPLDARRSNTRNFSFFGVPTNPIVVKDQILDKNEFLQRLLIPLDDWLRLIEEDLVQDGYSIVTTFLALRKLNRM